MLYNLITDQGENPATSFNSVASLAQRRHHETEWEERKKEIERRGGGSGRKEGRLMNGSRCICIRFLSLQYLSPALGGLGVLCSRTIFILRRIKKNHKNKSFLSFYVALLQLVICPFTIGKGLPFTDYFSIVKRYYWWCSDASKHTHILSVYVFSYD